MMATAAMEMTAMGIMGTAAIRVIATEMTLETVVMMMTEMIKKVVDK